MKTPSRILIAGFIIASAAITQIAVATTVAANPVSPLPCGVLRMLCVQGTSPQCIDGQWQCVPQPSSSSVSSTSSSSTSSSTSVSSASSVTSSAFSCAALKMYCVPGIAPKCINGQWQCPSPSTSSNPSSGISSSTQSSVPSTSSCGALKMLCVPFTHPECSNGQWHCVGGVASSASSESSASSLPCGALTMMCMLNTTPECINGKWNCVPNQKSSHPHITSVSPTSGPAGTEVTINGSGFSSTNNTVLFGTNTLINLPSSDGTHITFTAPDTWTIPCMQTNPRCMIATHPNYPGKYRVAVKNNTGRSNVSVFQLTAGMISSSSSSTVSISENSCMCPSGEAWDATSKQCVKGGLFMCPMYMLVGGWCGCDGKVYGNSCFAASAGVIQGQACSSMQSSSVMSEKPGVLR